MSEENRTPKASFFSTNLDQTEIREILERIEENLVFRQVLKEQSCQTEPCEHMPPIAAPSLFELEGHLQYLNALKAPLFVPAGRVWERSLKRLLNLPVRLFGYVQNLFNQRLLMLLSELMNVLQTLSEHAKVLTWCRTHVLDLLERNSALHEQVKNLMTSRQEDAEKYQQALAERDQLIAWCKSEIVLLANRQREDMEGIKSILKEHSNAVEEHQNRLAGLREEHHLLHNQTGNLSRIQEELNGTIKQTFAEHHEGLAWCRSQLHDLQTTWDAMPRYDDTLRVEMEEKLAEQCKSVKEDQNNTAEWIRLVQAELRSVALDVREMKKGPAERPYVQGYLYTTVKPLGATENSEDMQELRVNLGCGHRLLEGHLNIDFRELPGVDVVAAAHRLPFKMDSIAELTSSHLVEHFREHEFKTMVLPHWRSRLQPVGRLRIICPDWEAMLDSLRSGTMTLGQFKEITFGGQEYEGNDHYAMYTPQTLSDLLLEGGFSDIEVVATARDNGGCPEMELIATKS